MKKSYYSKIIDIQKYLVNYANLYDLEIPHVNSDLRMTYIDITLNFYNSGYSNPNTNEFCRNLQKLCTSLEYISYTAESFIKISISYKQLEEFVDTKIFDSILVVNKFNL